MKDIYTITPEVEAQLTHALTLLEDVLGDDLAYDRKTDPRVIEAWQTLAKLPFFAKNY